MLYELYKLKRPWRQSPEELLISIRTLEIGSLSEDFDIPAETRVDGTPSLMGVKTSDDDAEAIAKLQDQITRIVRFRGIWLSPDRLWAVTRPQRGDAPGS